MENFVGTLKTLLYRPITVTGCKFSSNYVTMNA